MWNWPIIERLSLGGELRGVPPYCGCGEIPWRASPSVAGAAVELEAGEETIELSAGSRWSLAPADMDWSQLRLRKHDGADAGGRWSGGPQFISGAPELRQRSAASVRNRRGDRAISTQEPEFGARARAPASGGPQLSKETRGTSSTASTKSHYGAKIRSEKVKAGAFRVRDKASKSGGNSKGVEKKHLNQSKSLQQAEAKAGRERS